MAGLRLAKVAVSAFLACATYIAQEDQGIASDSDFDFSGYEQRLAELEAEVQSLRSEPMQNRSCGPSIDCGACCKCSSTPHLDFGAEVVFLSPHSTTGLGPGNAAFFPSDDLFASWRTWLSYTGSNGLGLRARYWEFNHAVTNNLNVFIYDLDTFVVDVELTYSNVIGGDWDVQVSGGVRHVSFDETRIGTAQLVPTVDSDLTGVVVGGEIGRNLIGCVRGYGIVRAATVFGEASTNFAPSSIIDNKLSSMWESQLGLEYSRDTCIGEVSLRVGGEVQYWDSVTYRLGPSAMDAPLDESIGFIGVTTGFMLRR